MPRCTNVYLPDVGGGRGGLGTKIDRVVPPGLPDPGPERT